MKKNIAGILIGTVVLFGWGFVSWMVLPWHNSTVKTMPEEQLISDTLKTVIPDPGFYFFPSHTNAAGVKDDVAWTEKYKKGPHGVVIFSPQGQEPMQPCNFLVEIAANLLIAAVAMVLLSLCRDRVRGLIPRMVMVGALGLVVWAGSDLPYWNWFGFPTDFSMVALWDHLVGFLLLGLAEAKFVSEQ